MNIPELKPGLSHELVETVTHELTIQSYDPKLPAVFATPAMIRAMEVAAARAVQPRLPAGCLTVGTAIHVEHLAATPPGHRVTVRAVLTEVNGRFLKFAVEARDEKELIGRGTVERAIVEQDRFETKVRAKTPRPEV